MMDLAWKSKFDSMQRYGKDAWSRKHIAEIDKELRLHLHNMLDAASPASYWEMSRDRIDYLMNIRPEHLRNVDD